MCVFPICVVSEIRHVIAQLKLHISLSHRVHTERVNLCPDRMKNVKIAFETSVPGYQSTAYGLAFKSRGGS